MLAPVGLETDDPPGEGQGRGRDAAVHDQACRSSAQGKGLCDNRGGNHLKLHYTCDLSVYLSTAHRACRFGVYHTRRALSMMHLLDFSVFATRVYHMLTGNRGLLEQVCVCVFSSHSFLQCSMCQQNIVGCLSRCNRLEWDDRKPRRVGTGYPLNERIFGGLGR